MSGSLTRANFWGAAIPHQVQRSVRRVLVHNGLLAPSKSTINSGVNLAGCSSAPCNCGGSEGVSSSSCGE